MDRLAVEDDLARSPLLYRRHLADEGGFPRPVVTHHGDMLALVQDEVRIFQRVHATVVLGQSAGFQNDLRHGRYPRVRLR